MCDLETSRIGAPYIYDIRSLRVNEVLVAKLKRCYEIISVGDHTAHRRGRTRLQIHINFLFT